MREMEKQSFASFVARLALAMCQREKGDMGNVHARRGKCAQKGSYVTKWKKEETYNTEMNSFACVSYTFSVCDQVCTRGFSLCLQTMYCYEIVTASIS